MPIRKAQWKTDTQFNYGSPTLTNVEILGTGDEAYISLSGMGNLQTNIDFSTTSGLIFDPTKMDVTGDSLQLLASISGNYTWPLTSGSLYNYDSNLIEFTGGMGKLKANDIPVYAIWHLNESSGTLASDFSGNGRNGTLINMENGDWGAAKLGNGLTFDGINEYVNCGDIAGFERTNPFTLECWVKYSSTGNMGIMTKVAATVPYKGYFLMTTSGKPCIVISNTYGSNYIYVTVASAINNNAWRHLVVTYDGSSTAAGIIFYVDGSPVGMTTIADTLSSSITNSNNFQLSGRGGASVLFTGSLDECIVYDRELSPTQISFRYNSGLGTELPPVTYSTDNPTIEPKTGYTFTEPLSLFNITKTIPTNTLLKWILSYDDGVTYYYWNGSAWAVSNGTYSQSTSEADVKTNIINLALSGTFKWKAFLHTSTDSDTPELDNVYIAESVTYPTGSYVCEMNYDIQPDLVAQWLYIVETSITPDNTSIACQYSIDSGITWNESWLNATDLQLAIQLISTTGDGTDKIRFKFQLTTSDYIVTPELDNFQLESNSGYNITGYYESIAYIPIPANINGLYADVITFNTTTPANTSIIMQARAVSGVFETNYPEVESGDSLATCGYMLQWKATLNTSDSRVTPRINWVDMTFHVIVGIMQSIDTTVTSTNAITSYTSGQIETIQESLENIENIELGGWKLDNNTKQWIYYKPDNTTEIVRFNLYDIDDNPSVDNVFKRSKV